MKYSLLLLLVVLVGVGKGLGSVKETVSTIQELGERKERESVTTPFLCKESTALSGDTCHWVSSMLASSTTAVAHTTAPQEGSGIPAIHTTTWVCRRPLSSLRVDRQAKRVLTSA